MTFDRLFTIQFIFPNPKGSRNKIIIRQLLPTDNYSPQPSDSNQSLNLYDDQYIDSRLPFLNSNTHFINSLLYYIKLLICFNMEFKIFLWQLILTVLFVLGIIWVVKNLFLRKKNQK